jgi:endonuclease/exonuclease/phosphatase family metal-dependent hydrolase
MRLICLNTWGARAGEIFFDFVENNKETDIFCFQEIWSSRTNSDKRLENGIFVNELQRISKSLPNHVPISCPYEYNVDYAGSDPKNSTFGLASFVYSKIEITGVDECFVIRDRDSMIGSDARTLGRNVQRISLKIKDQEVHVFNFHGLWNSIDKNDCDERLIQSQNLLKYTNKFTGPKILCGDFNLLPNTKSLEIIKPGFRDLIKEFAIKDTRTSFYTKDIRYADYVFVSPEIKVNDFRVLPDEVSDHAALLLDFDIPSPLRGAQKD